MFLKGSHDKFNYKQSIQFYAIMRNTMIDLHT
jgi:hypothetical protein